AQPVERGRALDEHAQLRDVGEADRVVDAGADRLADVEPDLRRIDVEGGDELDVAHVIAAEHDVHEAGDGLVRLGVAVVLHALHEAAGAVSDAGDGGTNRTTHEAGAPYCVGSGWSARRS